MTGNELHREIEARQRFLDRAAGATEEERAYTRWRWALQERTSQRREALHRLLEARIS
ncbi:hypothetical protein Mrub_1984 [Meiothermus ruber DSM 1279]|uniref:Uncharacterized protein n=1 Tax=Meiothermus ruber (strain ATCC 35948 / DSM 1279 / VKM B-1258 / 21) TaxID=504728 RepID=D3PTF7_MEIRD|nr:hypothetical protein [Meiothermus ruber]ADD28740.1 hypothetical protein Mrub_1984 [Meiothermus ruber DSM 1279]AGK05812.1 hypothetical protein K649_12630 [Meiothermus ruber DSM 1279]